MLDGFVHGSDTHSVATWIPTSDQLESLNAGSSVSIITSKNQEPLVLIDPLSGNETVCPTCHDKVLPLLVSLCGTQNCPCKNLR
jgi:hypothetical protein